MSCAAIKVKRGGSLGLDHRVRIDGAVTNLTGWQFAAQVKQGTKVVDDFVITPVDLVLGLLRLDIASTEDWPVGTLAFDIKYTLPSGFVYYSPTLNITCSERITP